MKLSDFDYDLPDSLIASEPVEKRDESRLMILDRLTGETVDKHFSDIIELLNPDDVLVLNESKVFPARLIGQKRTGGRVEILLNHPLANGHWSGMGKKLSVGAEIVFPPSDLVATVIEKQDQTVEIEFNHDSEDIYSVLEQVGKMPLPPYIEHKRLLEKTKTDDRVRYQTVYAKTLGSSAAPTAGLHFTEELLRKIEQKGVTIIKLTLHVGLGTFLPVKIEDFHNHKMHEEFYSIGLADLNKISDLKSRGSRIVAVGTTTTRVLEHLYTETKDQRQKTKDSGGAATASGWTSIFIYPGYKFRCVDALITNFHLPKSTLLLLVSAFTTKEIILRAYDEAIKQNYRFYSYGDAMFIV